MFYSGVIKVNDDGGANVAVDTPTHSERSNPKYRQGLVHTIAICTANRREAFCNIFAQLINTVAFPRRTEIIVVNNGCQEDTFYISSRVEPYCLSRNIKLFVYHEERRGLSFARNTVLERANGDIVSFIDDDAVPKSSDWQQAVLEIFATKPHVALCGGPSWLVPPQGKKHHPWWRSDYTDTYFSCLYHHPEGPCHPGLIAGVNASYRVKAIGTARFTTSLGWGSGKAQSIAGEDTLFNEQVCHGTWTAWFEHRAIVLHLIEEQRYKATWILRRAFIGGKTEAAFHLIHGHDPGSLYFNTFKQLVKSLIRAFIRVVQLHPSSLFSELCSISSKFGVLCMTDEEFARRINVHASR